jgi:DNA polymerase/3'-5' exonuclease PolX
MIKAHPRPITSFEEAAALRGVGAKMAQKIVEILEYGKLSKVINLEKERKICSQNRRKP